GLLGGAAELVLNVAGNDLLGGGNGSYTSALNGVTYAQCRTMSHTMMCLPRRDGMPGCGDPCEALPGAPNPGAAPGTSTGNVLSGLADAAGLGQVVDMIADSFMPNTQYVRVAEEGGEEEYLFESSGSVMQRTNLDA